MLIFFGEESFLLVVFLICLFATVWKNGRNLEINGSSVVDYDICSQRLIGKIIYVVIEYPLDDLNSNHLI